MRAKAFTNIQNMLKQTIDDYREVDAYRWFSTPDRLASVTWGEFQEQVKRVSKSLIISYSCYRWVLSDIGISSIGACTVGIYHSNLPDDCRYIIDHSDAVIIFAQDETQLQKLMNIRNGIPDVRKVVMFSDYQDI